MSVDVRIEGFIANVESTLIYKNVSKDPIEVRYDFPMDDESVVYHFEAQIEDRIIIAECQEKQQVQQYRPKNGSFRHSMNYTSS